MRPSQIRGHSFDDHRRIGGRILSLEEHAKQVALDERRLIGPLRLEGDVLLSKLRHHMRWENVHLRPALVRAEARPPDVAKQEENPMWAAGASRTLVVTAALMLAVGVAACADDDASQPAKLSGVDAAARPEGAEETGAAPQEAVEEAPGGKAGPPAEPAKESPNGSGPPAAEPEPEEETREADRE